MESKLMSAYEELPLPKREFGAILERVPRGTGWKPWAVLAAAVMLLLVLCGAGWQLVSSRYGMWLRESSVSWQSVEWAGKKYDLVLPEKLNGFPFLNYRSYSLTPNGTPKEVAFWNPSYVPHCITYGWQQGEKDLGVSFGTTENELWRYYFQFDGEGNWTAWDTDYVTMEYKGFCLQIGTTSFYDETCNKTRATRWAHWMDEKRNVVVSINETDFEDPDRVVACAREIIDLNT